MTTRRWASYTSSHVTSPPRLQAPIVCCLTISPSCLSISFVFPFDLVLFLRRLFLLNNNLPFKKNFTYPVYSAPLIIQWYRAASHPAVLLPNQLNRSSPSRHLRGDHTTSNNNGHPHQSLAELAIATVHRYPLLALSRRLSFVPGFE